MLSIDSNILLPAVDAGHQGHAPAAAFLRSIHGRDDVVISEFILLELYVLLRNPAVVRSPLNAATAAGICEAYRAHPRWQLAGFPPDSRPLHDQLWPHLRARQFARRRVYDLRTALCLLRSGVTEFATVNIRDFRGLGFARVWNPLVTEARI
jgi:predicted nucleic acid-binding protein